MITFANGQCPLLPTSVKSWTEFKRLVRFVYDGDTCYDRPESMQREVRPFLRYQLHRMATDGSKYFDTGNDRRFSSREFSL